MNRIICLYKWIFSGNCPHSRHMLYKLYSNCLGIKKNTIIHSEANGQLYQTWILMSRITMALYFLQDVCYFANIALHICFCECLFRNRLKVFESKNLNLMQFVECEPYSMQGIKISPDFAVKTSQQYMFKRRVYRILNEECLMEYCKKKVTLMESIESLF